MLCDVQNYFKVIEDIKIVYTVKHRQKGNDKPKKQNEDGQELRRLKRITQGKLKNLDYNLVKFCKIR